MIYLRIGIVITLYNFLALVASKKAKTFLAKDEENQTKEIASIPALNAAGMKCEDSPMVEAAGIKCSILAKNIGALGCQRIIQELANEHGKSVENIPPMFRNKRIADACPQTCGLCELCAPGCTKWFIGNGWCEEACNNASCQFDGGDCWDKDCIVGPWGQWSECSVPCGPGGERVRRRDVLVKPNKNGKQCPPLIDKELNCNSDIKCPVDCKLSDWGNWSVCSAECGLGQVTRTREILVAPQNGGKPCGDLTQSADCFITPCNDSCKLSEFGEWSQCSSKIGSGSQIRIRQILKEPMLHDQPCGTLFEERKCVNFTDNTSEKDTCKFSDWSSWTVCSKSCGGGQTTRQRSVISGKCFDAPLIEKLACNNFECNEGCEYEEWGPWSPCSSSCGYGVQERTRQIKQTNNNAQKHCEKLTQAQPCYSGVCESDCYSEIETECTTNSNSCGLGYEVLVDKKFIENTCISKYVVSDCNIPCLDSSIAEIVTCKEWTDCVGNCEHGSSERICITTNDQIIVQKRECRPKNCHNSCEYDSFSDYVMCEKNCGGCLEHADRSVIKPSESGTECNELRSWRNCIDTIQDNEDWGPWGACIAPCNKMGFKSRIKTSEGKSNLEITKYELETTPCFRACNDTVNLLEEENCIYSQWSEWGKCSNKCGQGVMKRYREIIQGENKNCKNIVQSVPCYMKSCDKRCKVGSWSDWSSCSMECGKGSKFRSRKIEQLPTSLKHSCPVVYETQVCLIKECREDHNCEMSEWSEWTECTSKCGGGVQKRTRSVIKEAIDDGKCGSTKEVRGCNLQRCPNTKCVDHPKIAESPLNCSMLKTQGCHTNIRKLAREHNAEDQLPEELPPEARILDVCPMTCGVCNECAPGCELRDIGNTVCTQECNVEACNFDGGDCGSDCKLSDLNIPSGSKLETNKTGLMEGEKTELVCPVGYHIKGSTRNWSYQLNCDKEKQLVIYKKEYLFDHLEGINEKIKLTEELNCVKDDCYRVMITKFGKKSFNELNEEDINFFENVFTGLYEKERIIPGLITYRKHSGFIDCYLVLIENFKIFFTDPPNHRPIYSYSENQVDFCTSIRDDVVSFEDKWFYFNSDVIQRDKLLDVLNQIKIIENVEPSVFDGVKITAVDSLDTGISENLENIFTKIKLVGPSLIKSQCSDIPLVTKFAGISCDKLVYSLGCTYRLREADTSLTLLSEKATVATVCPQSCGLCTQECSKGCSNWFLGNGYCDEACNNENCAFDFGDCDAEKSTPDPTNKTPVSNVDKVTVADCKKLIALFPNQLTEPMKYLKLEDSAIENSSSYLKYEYFFKTRHYFRHLSSFVCIISTLCQKECYRCDISQSERIDDCADDLEIVENSLFSTCEYLISFAGCAANLKQVLSQHTSIPKFVLDNIDENLDIDDLCPMSCQRCPAFNVNEECEDSEIFAQYDFSCSGLVAYAENGCRTQLKDLNLSKTIKQKIVKDKGIDMNTQLSVFCLKTCDVCNVQGISKEVTIIGLLSTSMSIAEACESSMSSVAKGTSYESIAQPGLAVKTLCAKECHTCGYVSCDDGFCNGDEEWIDCGE
uniref:Uncharacterized protein LOC113788369 n=1 Tax=Dermatophagoides pteronyssinus TaxID=6956 RepID=A0A6P6XLK8_DERPT|nr:uncharacterized protein LOC113788369 [Dermatophagoides pteronyssinus]